MSLPKFTQQPGDALDYDIDFSDFLPSSDTILTVVNTITPAGVTQPQASVINNTTKRVKVWLTGGTDGTSYHVTTKITTQEGRTKEQDWTLKVKAL